MIRFFCEFCAHKIRVHDKDIGRQGKCPQCGKVIRIPTDSTIIDFNCENCGKEISAPKSHTGKKVICPRCYNQFKIPLPHFQGFPEIQEYSGDLVARTTDSTHGLTLIDVPEEYKLKDEPATKPSISEEDLESEETEPIEQRKLPWFVDILLYPISIPGLLHLGIFTIIPFLLSLIMILLGPLGMAIAFPAIIINIAILLYLYWYVTECVRDSAKGGLRAPEAFATAGLEEMLWQAIYIVGCCLVFMGPAYFYSLYSNRTDIAYWLLLICGVFFLPMGLLSCVMFDSIRGLNPLLIIVSILSTFLHYIGLVLLITCIVLGYRAIAAIQTELVQRGMMAMMFLENILRLVLLYITFVAAHLLGRFFYRYEDKLYWEV